MRANICVRLQDSYIGQFATFQEAYDAVVPNNTITGDNIGGRLIPRSLLEIDSARMLEAIEYIVGAGGVFSGVSTNVSGFPINVENSVNPLWRTTIFNTVIALYVSSQFFCASRLPCAFAFLATCALSYKRASPYTW